MTTEQTAILDGDARNPEQARVDATIIAHKLEHGTISNEDLYTLGAALYAELTYLTDLVRMAQAELPAVRAEIEAKAEALPFGMGGFAKGITAPLGAFLGKLG